MARAASVSGHGETGLSTRAIPPSRGCGEPARPSLFVRPICVQTARLPHPAARETARKANRAPKYFFLNQMHRARFGGRGGIRTHGELAPTAVFKTAALNHSATLPRRTDVSPARARLSRVPRAASNSRGLVRAPVVRAARRRRATASAGKSSGLSFMKTRDKTYYCAVLLNHIARIAKPSKTGRRRNLAPIGGRSAHAWLTVAAGPGFRDAAVGFKGRLNELHKLVRVRIPARRSSRRRRDGFRATFSVPAYRVP